MNDYAYQQLRYRCKTGVSIYDICAKALRKAGHQQPPGLKDKAWVLSMADVVKRGAKAFQVLALESKLKTNASCAGYSGNVNDDAFLSSFQWRSLRMKVLSHYGRRCMCCGASPDNGVVMHVDHIKPRRFFPHLALDFDNLQVLCEVCNHGKGNHDHTDWRPAEGDYSEQSIRQLLRDIAGPGHY